MALLLSHLEPPRVLSGSFPRVAISQQRLSRRNGTGMKTQTVDAMAFLALLNASPGSQGSCFRGPSQSAVLPQLGPPGSLRSSGLAGVLWVWSVFSHKNSQTYSLIPPFQCINATPKMVHFPQWFSFVFLSGHITSEESLDLVGKSIRSLNRMNKSKLPPLRCTSSSRLLPREFVNRGDGFVSMFFKQRLLSHVSR